VWDACGALAATPARGVGDCSDLEVPRRGHGGPAALHTHGGAAQHDRHQVIHHDWGRAFLQGLRPSDGTGLAPLRDLRRAVHKSRLLDVQDQGEADRLGTLPRMERLRVPLSRVPR